MVVFRPLLLQRGGMIARCMSCGIEAGTRDDQMARKAVVVIVAVFIIGGVSLSLPSRARSLSRCL